MMVPFAAWHLQHLRPPLFMPELLAGWDLTDSERLRVLESAEDLSWSLMSGSEFLGCGGVVPVPGESAHAVAWAVRSARLPLSVGSAVTERGREIFHTARALGFELITTTVLAGHAAGARWVETLGMTRVGTLKGYFADGRSAWVYAVDHRSAA